MDSDAGKAEGRVRLLDKEGAAQRIATQNMQLSSERQTSAQDIISGTMELDRVRQAGELTLTAQRGAISSRTIRNVASGTGLKRGPTRTREISAKGLLLDCCSAAPSLEKKEEFKVGHSVKARFLKTKTTE